MNRPTTHVYVEYSPQFQAGVGKSPSFTKLGKVSFIQFGSCPPLYHPA
jgi:hypothetical protein